MLILGIMFFFRGVNKPSPEDSSGLIIGKNAIYATEQKTGNTISVSIVRLEKPGFAVVHEDNAGSVGEVLGMSGLLSAGETENPSAIELSRQTADGETVYVMLHLDNGDGVFDPASDIPALDSVSGEPIMIIVPISKDAEESGPVNL